MNCAVTTVKRLPGHRIQVEIGDQRKGIVDLTPDPEHGVFRELRLVPPRAAPQPGLREPSTLCRNESHHAEQFD